MNCRAAGCGIRAPVARLPRHGSNSGIGPRGGRHRRHHDGRGEERTAPANRDRLPLLRRTLLHHRKAGLQARLDGESQRQSRVHAPPQAQRHSESDGAGCGDHQRRGAGERALPNPHGELGQRAGQGCAHRSPMGRGRSPRRVHHHVSRSARRFARPGTPGSEYKLNSYARQWKEDENYVAINNLDADGDGYTNVEEIAAHTFPGKRIRQPLPR